jgi:hypothetical protein
MTRHIAYGVMGGEVARRRRKLVRDPEIIRGIVASYRKGATQAELAAQHEISVSQLRRLLESHPQRSRKTSEKRRGRPRKSAETATR